MCERGLYVWERERGTESVAMSERNNGHYEACV